MKNPILKFIKTFHTNKQPAFLDIIGDDIIIQMNIPHTNPAILYATRYKDHIYINDFKTKIKGIGYGTKMLNKLIDYARNEKIEYINGIITSYDLEHTPYLTQFYKKFGFELSEGTNENAKYNIILYL